MTDLSAYSTKYTGYPITNGTLTVDVHYLLDQQKLTAENHIFIDQLTFGDKVESPNAINLPIRLAVAILKNSQGQIDLHLPVSGSLSDPQFSIGGIVLACPHEPDPQGGDVALQPDSFGRRRQEAAART